MARSPNPPPGGSRILRTEVAARFPKRGPIYVFLVGEAPGPRGADQSGIPFWGDRSGRALYAVLVDTGFAEVPDQAWEQWDGAALRQRRLEPTLRGAVLSNALPRCPTDDGERFRAPKDSELGAPANLARLVDELQRAAARCPATRHVVTLGKRAELAIDLALAAEGAPGCHRHRLPHPSAQGLLNSAPNRGKGAKLDELEAAWRSELARCLGAAREAADHDSDAPAAV